MKNENYVRYRKSLHSMENATKKSFQNHIMRLSAKSRWGSQIMYKWILNKREYLGPDWPTDVWPADDIAFCSIFTYFQYWRIYDLALSNTIKMTHIVWFWLTWSIKTNRTIVRTTLYEYALCKDLPQVLGMNLYLLLIWYSYVCALYNYISLCWKPVGIKLINNYLPLNMDLVYCLLLWVPRMYNIILTILKMQNPMKLESHISAVCSF